MSTTMRPAIRVRDLRKVFTVTRRAPGLRHAVRSLVAPVRDRVEALAGISLDVHAGERLALIGPNGAGKSTMIKILTGILQPTSGSAEVLGLVPWRRREALARRIGTVFGQRPQLWYHLPAADTLRLLAALYDLDGRAARRRIDELSEAFDLGELLHTPVRKLSLGQRMRCEVAASFLHRPQLILLDEPSIGLDVVAKRRIREMVVRLSDEEGVAVLVTSHDAGDIEAMCRRVVIVDRGVVAYSDDLANLRRSYLTTKRLHAHFAAPAELGALPSGVRVLEREATRMVLRVEAGKVPIDAVLSMLGRAGELTDLVISEPALEEVIHAVFTSRRVPRT